MNKRLKELRKAEGLTQREFGRRLGVQDTAISKLESGERNLTDQMILAVCREFNVNEDWLRTGNGKMIVENDNTIISELVSELKLDDMAKNILLAYKKLDKPKREGVLEFIRELAFTVVQEVATDTRKEVLDILYNADIRDEDEYDRVFKEMLETFNGAFSYSKEYVAPYEFDEAAHNEYYGLDVDKAIKNVNSKMRAATGNDNNPPEKTNVHKLDKSIDIASDEDDL